MALDTHNALGYRKKERKTEGKRADARGDCTLKWGGGLVVAPVLRAWKHRESNGH